jgi:hypothetical protein
MKKTKKLDFLRILTPSQAKAIFSLYRRKKANDFGNPTRVASQEITVKSKKPMILFAGSISKTVIKIRAMGDVVALVSY